MSLPAQLSYLAYILVGTLCVPADTILGWNSLTDLYLTIMPATIVYNLRMSRAKKFGVSLLLGVSFL